MILLPVIVALVLAVFCARGSTLALRIAPVAGIGPLAAALLPAETLQLPMVLVGMRFESDPVAQPLLLLAGIVWTLAGWYARGAVVRDITRFWTWWNFTLAGVTLALLAADIAGFYAGYAATTLAAYGLIVHDGSAAARRAGRIYLSIALVAEMAILYGLLTLAGGDDLTPAVHWMLFAGFAVKLGIVPLHFWLPLAHSIAPAPASAVLSGVIVKIGLLGWLRFLPQSVDIVAIVPALVTLGVVASFYGAFAGLGQQRLKSVLAYSTVSQAGLLCVGFALVLGGQPTGPLLLFALHHGLNKAALFVGAGVGVGSSRARLALMALPAASIVGVPFTTGFVAKGGLKYQLYESGLAGWPMLIVSLTAFSTTLLMVRALWLAARDEPRDAIHPAWVLLVLAGVAVPWAWALGEYREFGIIEALWPIAAALVVAFAWLRSGRRGPAVPEGDLLAWFAALRRPPLRLPAKLRLPAPDWGGMRKRFGRAVARGEDTLMRLPGTGFALLILTGALWWLLR